MKGLERALAASEPPGAAGVVSYLITRVVGTRGERCCDCRVEAPGGGEAAWESGGKAARSLARKAEEAAEEAAPSQAWEGEGEASCRRHASESDGEASGWWHASDSEGYVA